MQSKSLYLSLLLALLLPAGSALAQGRRRAKPPQPAKPEAKEEEKKKAEDEEEDEPAWLAVKNGDFYTGTGRVIRQGVLLAKDGVIEQLGEPGSIEIPEEATIVDAGGRRVYPGLVAFSSRRIVGSTPEDSTDPFSLNMTLALANGMTTVATSNRVCKLTFGTLEKHVIARDMHVGLNIRGARAREALREQLERLRQYDRELRAYRLAKSRGDKEAKEPDKKWIRGNYANLQRLMKGERRALVSASDRDDLLYLCHLGTKYGIKFTVQGAVEGWIVADEMGRAGMAAIINPRPRARFGAAPRPDRRLLRESGWSIENAARLRQGGVQVAIMSVSNSISLGGLASSDLLTFPLEGAFAMRGGLSEEDAVAALTLIPARLLGVDDQIGTLEVGKDCDLAIVDGGILDYDTLVEWTVVNGRIVYDKAKDSIFREIRPRDEDMPKSPQLWPRELGEMPIVPDLSADEDDGAKRSGVANGETKK